MFPQSVATVTNLLAIAGQYSNYRVLGYIFIKYWCWISLWDRYGIHNTRMSHRLLLEFVRSIFSDMGCVRKTDFLYQQYIIMLLSLSLSHYLTLDDTPPPHPLSSFDLFSHHFHFRHFRFWQIYWKQMYQFGIILSCHFKLWRHCIVWHIPSLFETKMFYPFIVKHIW